MLTWQKGKCTDFHCCQCQYQEIARTVTAAALQTANKQTFNENSPGEKVSKASALSATLRWKMRWAWFGACRIKQVKTFELFPSVLYIYNLLGYTWNNKSPSTEIFHCSVGRKKLCPCRTTSHAYVLSDTWSINTLYLWAKHLKTIQQCECHPYKL